VLPASERQPRPALTLDQRLIHDVSDSGEQKRNLRLVLRIIVEVAQRVEAVARRLIDAVRSEGADKIDEPVAV
jgi:hypothetical protein